MKIGSLFSGYGGLDIAVESFFHAETVWHAEWEDAPSKVLAHHWPGVPNFRDVTQVDWESVEPVDIITGGFPCQDVSSAGKRAGMVEGTRSNLWGAMRTAIETIRPKYVVAENVRGLLSATADSDLESCPGCVGETEQREHTMRALGRVLGDLADLGYDAKWHGLRAADIGAPHNRFRVFILATNTAGAGQGRSLCKRRLPRKPRGVGGSLARGKPERDLSTVEWGNYEPAIRRWEMIAGPSPSPVEFDRIGEARLNPKFTEWMMGLPTGWITDIGGISSSDQLKMCGNGVVPQQAYEALRRMKEAA